MDGWIYYARRLKGHQRRDYKISLPCNSALCLLLWTWPDTIILTVSTLAQSPAVLLSLLSCPIQPHLQTVSNESANLHIWHQGIGALLILIQGGGGDGSCFNTALPSLSE
jgi:hypothetical protein